MWLIFRRAIISRGVRDRWIGFCVQNTHVEATSNRPGSRAALPLEVRAAEVVELERRPDVDARAVAPVADELHLALVVGPQQAAPLAQQARAEDDVFGAAGVGRGAFGGLVGLALAVLGDPGGLGDGRAALRRLGVRRE